MRTLAAAVLTVATAALAACGSSSSAGTSGGSNSSTTSSSSSAAPTPTPTPTPTPPGVTVGTASVTGVGTVLVDASNHTLYRFTPEAGGSIACTGACATNWPPTVLPPGAMVQPSASLPGKFGSVARPDGTMQITYNGWPLYAFAGDTAAGTANGQGKLGKWFAATPDTPSPGAAASPTM